MQRRAELSRRTQETEVSLILNIDGSGDFDVKTGIPFFDHMLQLFARHALVDLVLVCKGDLQVDLHHTVEDCGLALGKAFDIALGSREGIRRYGTGFCPHNPLWAEEYVPMDESLARCIVDFGGRPYFVWRGLDQFDGRLLVSELNSDMAMRFRFGLAKEFFRAFSTEARCNLHMELLYGQEPHHIVEALFKAFGRAVRSACERDPRLGDRLPTTKGIL